MSYRLDTRRLAASVKARRGNRSLREAVLDIEGVSLSTLSRVEAGKMIDVATFLHLCDWLVASPQEFITNANTMNLLLPIEEKRREMKEAQKAIDGIVLIEVDLDQMDRVQAQLTELAGCDTIVYRAAIGTSSLSPNEKFFVMLLYLELLGSQWEQVIPWCTEAYDAGLLLSYRFAETGPMLIAAPQQM